MSSDRKSMADSPSAAFVNSQAHLLKATSDNPLPTAVPPPIAATAGTLGVRHVLCLIGLPERGKPFIARRLDGYLSFFHGAQVKRFNINDYVVDDPGSDTNADKLHQDLRKFMMGNDETSARNMDSLKNELHIDENDRRRKNVDSGKVAIVYATESHSAFKEKWAGTSKSAGGGWRTRCGWTRRWARSSSSSRSSSISPTSSRRTSSPSASLRASCRP